MLHFAAKTLQSAAPVVAPPTAEQIGALTSFLSNHKKITFLTGAGISTTSGM
jgi:thiamine pyrophosphate-dependent acetolactate synthase large subunit-like protein